MDGLLGLDVSPTKMGWGLVHDDGHPDHADVFTLDGSPESTRTAVRAIEMFLEVHSVEPVVAYVEMPYAGAQRRGLIEAGVAIGYVEMVLRDCWPHIVIDRVLPAVWRSRVGVPSPPKGMTYSARKAWLKAHDVATAEALGFILPTVGKRVLRPSDDAADGALLAYCAWVDLQAGRIERLAA